LNKDDVGSTSDSDSSSVSESGPDNEERKSPPMGKVSAAPATSKRHGSDNDSDNIENLPTGRHYGRPRCVHEASTALADMDPPLAHFQ
jgi:hypothetical protein